MLKIIKKVFCICINFRFTNMLHLTNLDDQQIWKLMEQIKSETEFGIDCHDLPNIEDDDILSLVKAIEIELNVNSTEAIFENVTKHNLKTIGETFIYLYSCSKPLKNWMNFYEDLFQNQPPDIILLFLNRILKGKKTIQNSHLKTLARKLLNQYSSLLSLQYQEIGKLNRMQTPSLSSKDFIGKFACITHNIIIFRLNHI